MAKTIQEVWEDVFDEDTNSLRIIVDAGDGLGNDNTVQSIMNAVHDEANHALKITLN